MSVAVTVELPEEIAARFRADGTKDLKQATLEALAIIGYRSQILSGKQVMQMLGLPSRYELDAFLHANEIYFDYSPEDIERDANASRKASSLHLRK